MTFQILLALLGFAFVSSITPGPNNMMLMASGANFGFRRSIPHILGVGLGHSLMIVILGAGLMQLFMAAPVVMTVMKWASIGYLVYLAWKIANSGSKKADTPETEGKPLTFFQAAAFQWVNPKGWMMALTALSAYTVDQSMTQVLLVATVFMATNLPSITFWVVLGQQARRWLNTAGRLKWFNWTMAVLLLLSVAPVVMGH